MATVYAEASMVPAIGISACGQTKILKPTGTVMLEKPEPAPPVIRLSSAPLTASDREIGRKIAVQYGLTSRTEQFPPYGIVASSEFSAMFEQLVSNSRMRDEIQRAFEADLPINPDKFETIEGTSVQRAIINCCPPLRVFFTVKDRTITLLQIHSL